MTDDLDTLERLCDSVDAKQAEMAHTTNMPAAVFNRQIAIDHLGCRTSEIRGLIAEARASRWQPIETAPARTDVHVYIPHERGPGGWQDTAELLYDKEFGQWEWWTQGGRFVAPTHWMPLPAAPQEGGES